MDYSESLIYLRIFLTRCEDAMLKRNPSRAVTEAEHVVAEAIQLHSTLVKVAEASCEN